MAIDPAESDPSPVNRPREVIADLLQGSAIPMATLQTRYGPLLRLVQAMIGVVPNCDEYLEIWPPAFRSYNIMVPNFLNLPFSFLGLGGAPAAVVGLGLYVASRAAGCPYCSAHTCSFALRRGASPEKIAEALVGGSSFSPGELATIGVARSLGSIPYRGQPSERLELERRFSADDAEWIVAGIAMMGFLNKFMDAAGVELEPSVVAEVRGVMGAGWSPGKAGRNLDGLDTPGRPPAADSLRTKLSVIPLLPYAIRTDQRWQRGVPKTWPAAGSYLEGLTGHGFPLLSRLRHARVIQSIASMIRDNLDPATSVLGLELKVLCGAVFASVIEDADLSQDIRALGPKLGLPEERLREAERFGASDNAPGPGADDRQRAALTLARAASPSPARIDASVVAICERGGLEPAAIVELIGWLSLLQMLHRLGSYYPASG